MAFCIFSSWVYMPHENLKIFSFDMVLQIKLNRINIKLNKGSLYKLIYAYVLYFKVPIIIRIILIFLLSLST